ncbi:type II toxin-antitoxin system VapC family toxin [Dyadobacter sp. CY356]|uniref:type II toxin-antitoxin system VapC family toxin n=1 Tax=Dyadobacter sp. CY356 TaxID=2906442 RepID=UPI001F3407F5|nr:type II toxin-antitoxin system VapC family toxin [Dyadobacter sp. CY356]MCF0056939.1 type II toxin-antitoxin system VapC family toxin [Dyadobacter sp. CY356]
MQQYLLDTHTLLWMQDDNKNLSPLAKKILSDGNSQLYVSIASFWEVTIKLSLRKLELEYTIDELFTACEITNIVILPIEIAFLKELHSLPFFHKDPFDRIIAATALSLDLSIITIDEYIKRYNLKTIW